MDRVPGDQRHATQDQGKPGHMEELQPFAEKRPGEDDTVGRYEMQEGARARGAGKDGGVTRSHPFPWGRGEGANAAVPLLTCRSAPTFVRMFDAAAKAFAQMFSPPLRGVLVKAVGLALLFIVFIGIALQRVLAGLADSGATWAEQTAGFAPHSVWAALAWFLSIMASLGIITGAVFLMPPVTALVGSFFVDDVADAVEREHYPAETPGTAVPLMTGVIEGIKIALLSLLVYVVALPFVLFAGFGFLILYVATAYLLSREYFELAAMRFRPPAEAIAMRKANAGYIFIAGLVIALFVSIPILNFATPIFAMAFMVHIHKKLAGRRVELIEPAR